MSKIAFDLDNTLIPCGYEFELEKRNFLHQLFGFEGLRKGTIAFFKNLQAQKHEVWIYTTSFRKITYIYLLFLLYGIKLNGIVNQNIHNQRLKNKIKVSKFPPEFGIDVLIDDSKGVKMEGEKYNFKVICIEANDKSWVETVLKEL